MKNNTYTGILLAIIATIIWSGNFIIARGIAKEIAPVTLAFYRWLTASIIIFPFAYKTFIREIHVVRKHFIYLFWVALTGISLFNTFLYVAAHYTTAINLALIGTTSSPVMAIILAAIFLKERILSFRIAGLVICIAGILLLLSKGKISTLIGFHFTKGDWWTLIAALTFAIYNTLIKKKPPQISATSFLFSIFFLGSLILLPFYIWDLNNANSIKWDGRLLTIILYLGLGASVISYMCWNLAIGRLGSARTALFGNLIPLFSIIEAVLFLNERIAIIHIFSGILIIAGLVMANVKNGNATASTYQSTR